MRQARLSTTTTQRSLGAQARRPQSTIGRLEASTHDVHSDTLAGLLQILGYRLIAVPTERTPVAEHALAIRQFVIDGRRDLGLRVAFQIADDLAASHGVERMVLAAAPPPPTTDARFDALVAGITEHRLAQEGLPLPAWLGHGTTLDQPWVVSPHATVTDTHDATPEPLRRRLVYIDASDLESV